MLYLLKQRLGVGNISEDVDKNEFLEQLFLKHYAEMELFAAHFFRNPDIAQDVVQETFLIAQQKIDILILSPNPIGWLMLTLKNVIGDTYRKRKRLADISYPLEMTDSLTADGINISLRAKYEGIIGKDELTLLIWIYCEDTTYEAAAGRLGIGLDAVKKRIQRAKLQLKTALGEKIFF